MNTTINVFKNGLNTLFMVSMTVAEALAKPNGITVNLNGPYLILNAVLAMHLP